MAARSNEQRPIVLIYAVIATALFGGKLQLAPEDQSLRLLFSFEFD